MAARSMGAMRRARTLALALLGTAVVASACGEVLGEDPPPPDAIPDGGQVARAECPAALPADGESCLLPEGTTCAFDVCAGRIALCTRGQWRLAGNPPARPQCPDPPPGSDDPCPPCWAPDTLCSYGAACTSPDAGERRAFAQCSGPGWVVTFEVCRDGGGPDVQGDAGADSD